MHELFLAVLLTLAAEEESRAPGLAVGYQMAQVQRAEVASGLTNVAVETNGPAPSSGYAPLRIFIDNTSGPRGEVVLTYRSNQGGTAAQVTRAVELQGGERLSVTMPIPVELRYGSVTASGPGISSKRNANLVFNALPARSRLVLALGRPEAFEKFVGKPPSYSATSLSVQVIPVPEAPSDLATYVGYDTVVVTDPEAFEAMSEAQRGALEAFAATGGTLMVRGPLRAKASFPLFKETDKPDQAYGLGTLVVVQTTPVRSLSSSKVGVSPLPAPNESERRYGNGGSWAALLPQATAPLGRFLIIIGLFTLAIGPGSLWVSRRRGPAFLLVTIPGTAFITCAAIIGYSLLSDGFTVHTSVFGYTWLDTPRHRSINVGVSAWYANLAPSSATFSNTTAVVAPWVEGREHFVAGMDWKNGAHFGTDFVPSRLYREWGVLAVEPTRARVVVKKQGSGFVVQNALGESATLILVRLGERTWRAQAVPDGAERPLELDYGSPLPTLTAVPAQRFDSRLAARAAQPLSQGEFIASLKGPGFLPMGGLTTTLQRAEHIVRGEVEE